MNEQLQNTPDIHPSASPTSKDFFEQSPELQQKIVESHRRNRQELPEDTPLMSFFKKGLKDADAWGMVLNQKTLLYDGINRDPSQSGPIPGELARNFKKLNKALRRHNDPAAMSRSTGEVVGKSVETGLRYGTALACSLAEYLQDLRIQANHHLDELAKSISTSIETKIDDESFLDLRPLDSWFKALDEKAADLHKLPLNLATSGIDTLFEDLTLDAGAQGDIPPKPPSLG